MASLRKGKCYRNVTRPYTRKSKYKKKGFVKAIPAVKIVRYHMGDPKREFSASVKLVAKGEYQIRHNALESCRQMINKHLQNTFGNKGYHFFINIVPHQVLRENKMLTGAGADRMQTGMAHAFGKPVGTAAIVRDGTIIFTINIDKENVEKVKQILEKAKPRIPGKVGVEITNLVEANV
jgi:large subunit ribosomal protein L10e